MNRDAAIAIAKKLRALAEKSIDGERVASTKKLHEFCFKHGLDEDEYSIETIKVAISFNGENEKLLLSSIMCMILEVDAVKGKQCDEKLIFQCTTRQLEDIVEAFTHYKKVYQDYAYGAVIAIINRNEIKNKKTSKSEFKMEDMTEDERKEYDELMSRGKIEPVQQKDQSGSTESVKTEEETSNKSADRDAEQNRLAKKNDRIQRMLMVVEQNQWVKKIKSKLFLS